VSTAYCAADWTDLFVASAGASAALTGLLFVAVSVNIKDILENPALPARALQTLLLLLGAVVVSLVGLVPAQSATALGVELLILSLGFGGWVVILAARALEETRKYVRPLFHFALIMPGVLPGLVGAISLLARGGGGLYWVAGGIVGALLSASVNAWVLLVEILR
jgi:ABC-type spermidine/putrescine transport system permease subunit II